MNEILEDELTKKRNMLYYNQLIMTERREKAKKAKRAKKQKKSFASQEVSFKDFLYIPENWEFIFYTFYGIGIPYLTGAIFLFLFVANGSYENFKLLNMNAFLIIWLIGYEIVAVFALIWILILYIKYEPDENFY